MCFHSKNLISPILAPVSLSVWSSVAVLCVPAHAIRLSISASVGMNGNPLSWVYFGCCHVFPMCFR